MTMTVPATASWDAHDWCAARAHARERWCAACPTLRSVRLPGPEGCEFAVWSVKEKDWKIRKDETLQ